MITMTKLTRMRPGRSVGMSIALAFAVVAAGCDSLLEVELPGQVTEDATFVASQARLIVNSAIADVECAYSDFTAFEAAGYDDTTTRTVGWWGSRFERPATPNTSGNCAGSQENQAGAWFKPMQKGRWLAEQVYERLLNQWTVAQVPAREELLGTAALYAGIAYTYFGEFFCEVTVDTGPLMTWDQALAQGEQWLTTALGHINTNGDYAIATGITTSARQMALLMRARNRFAQNTTAKNAEAVLDAQQITQGFTAWVTRDDGAQRSRFNRVYSAHVGLGWVALLGPINWWTGTNSTNPLTGQPWPAVIPFTGHWNLSIGPEGRTTDDSGNPVTTTNTPGSTLDPRVPSAQIVGTGIGAGPNNYPRWEQRKYTNAGADLALAKWEEAWLIRAQVAGGMTAITLVNEIRAARSLPLISGAYLASLTDGTNDAQQIQVMLLEEIRRTFFLEGGRWWSHKIRYDLWFPRSVGQDQWNFNYQGGVRMAFPTNEFTENPNLTPADQGVNCPTSQRPLI